MSHLLTYNFKEQNNLILGFSRNYRFTGLPTLFDTVIQTYNYKTINAINNTNTLSAREEVSISYLTPTSRGLNLFISLINTTVKPIFCKACLTPSPLTCSTTLTGFLTAGILIH